MATFQPIGHVQNGFDEPIRAEVIRATESQIVLDPALTEGLTGLEPGDRVLVIFHFDRSPADPPLLQHPRGDRSRPRRGVFALRSPHRPNPIAVSEAELIAIDGNVLRIRGLDALNGTPVLDLKPA